MTRVIRTATHFELQVEQSAGVWKTTATGTASALTKRVLREDDPPGLFGQIADLCGMDESLGPSR